MGDLYSGLIRPYLRKGKNGEQFWGQFDLLDKANPPSTDFLKIQIEALQALEGTERYDAVNSFLKNAQSRLAKEASDTEKQVSDEVYSRIIALINSGLRGSKANPYKKVKTSGLTQDQIRKNAQSGITEILTELDALLEEANVSKSLSADIVAAVNKRLQSFTWDKTPHDYIMTKADLVEALMVDKINQDPTLRAIVTGAWIDSSGKQLIEDAFAFSKDKINIPFEHGSLTCTFTVDGKSGSITATSIEDFLNQVEALNGKSLKVSVPDELYKELRKAATIAGQAKSGDEEQAILNKNKRNAISLNDVDFDPMLLWELYEADLATRTDYFKATGEQDSKTLEALSNYCLSKNVAKTALSFNQLYLTANGFVSASQWMQLHSKYLIFQPAVRSVDGQFLTRQRPYFFNQS